MKNADIRKVLENPPENCFDCPFKKETRSGNWTSASICRLTNESIYNDNTHSRAHLCPITRGQERLLEAYE